MIGDIIGIILLIGLLFFLSIAVEELKSNLNERLSYYKSKYSYYKSDLSYLTEEIEGRSRIVHYMMKLKNQSFVYNDSLNMSLKLRWTIKLDEEVEIK